MIHRLWLATACFAVACGTETVSSPIPDTDEEFTASLAGTNTVPPVTTTATGTARFAVVFDSFLVFRVDVGDLDSAIAVRIHRGPAGAEDTTKTLMTLFSGVSCRNAAGAPINTASPSCRLNYTGQLSEGQFKPSLLAGLDTTFGATPRERFDSLLVLMRSGGVYVEVRTRLNPIGEIRGQVQSAP